MNGAEYSAYLHAAVGPARKDKLEFQVDYDDHYCGWFASHPSRWTVHLSDDTRRLLAGSVPEKQTIEVPKGLGKHILWSAKVHAETGNQASR
jgi:hypothetical protein